MSDRETTLLAGRVKRIEQILGRELSPPQAQPHASWTEGERAYLRETAEELFWNDLEWEKLTGEERMDEAFLTELAFPGFLAFVRGLLLTETMPDSTAPPRPRPEVVDDILRFLAEKVVAFEEHAACLDGAECEHKEAELVMTDRLVDLVLYLKHGLEREDVSRVEAARTPEPS